jgi:hypothetical protein
MSELDRYLASLGADADYGEDAAERLLARIAAEPAPNAIASRRRWATSLACVSIACVSGATVAACVEAGRPAPAVASILPIDSPATPTALLFGEGG